MTTKRRKPALRFKPVTKPGRYGKLYLYTIRWRDGINHDHTGESRSWAYDPEHLADKFYEDQDGDSFELTSYARVTDGPRDTWKWHRA